jgi:hypothetical protein
MKKAIVVNQHCTLEALSSIEYVDIGNKIAVFRLGTSLSSEDVLPGMLRIHSQDKTVEGFDSIANIKAFIKGSREKIGDASYALARLELLDSIAKYGYSIGPAVLSQNLKTREFTFSNPYTEIVKNGIPITQVYRGDNWRHQAFAIDGSVIPTGIKFDYMSGRMNNGAYDLRTALAILKDHPRIIFCDTKDKLKAKPSILEVPYYNSEYWCSHHLSFFFEPTKEEAQALWDHQKTSGQDIYRSVFDLDILGLKKGEATHYESYDGNRQYDPKFSNER